MSQGRGSVYEIHPSREDMQRTAEAIALSCGFKSLYHLRRAVERSFPQPSSESRRIVSDLLNAQPPQRSQPKYR